MMKVGIFFGGRSREREISFAGGRTVYDNLDKSLFEPVPIFVDSLGHFILLDWQFIYKGTIRDFYPPAKHARSRYGFQLYAEHLTGTDVDWQALIAEVGTKVSPEDFAELMDFAFLTLHGPYGEDGNIQGLLEWYGIPYSGAGILPSAIGIDKTAQSKLIAAMGFARPKSYEINYYSDIQEMAEEDFDLLKAKIGLPMVIKAARQGSSIGVSVFEQGDVEALKAAISRAFFEQKVQLTDWQSLSSSGRKQFVAGLIDIRSGIGLPADLLHEGGEEATTIHHPDALLDYLNVHLLEGQAAHVQIWAKDFDRKILIEEFIGGKEFSCIVIEDESGTPIALPPTGIVKGSEVFDYRAKYLPGISRKVTPIDLPAKQVRQIRQACCELFEKLCMNVYARIDGFITDRGEVYLNDPNTTSGMLPSSFFFHQAAEIGLSPSQFLTYIIQSSLAARELEGKLSQALDLFTELDEALEEKAAQEHQARRVGVLMGGWSSERHISVESGRNVFEKLASSEDYEPVPIFLTGSPEAHELYILPIHILLKDHADDIREKILHALQHPRHEAVLEIVAEAQELTEKYAGNVTFQPVPLTYEQLSEHVDEVFIALHGRPGEDGDVQTRLQKLGIPYNGSKPESASLTIDKYRTNALLREHGFHVASHALVQKADWEKNQEAFLAWIEEHFPYPIIAKPHDDGCSSAVKLIKTRQELAAYTEQMFRDALPLLEVPSQVLKLSPKEEFPMKDCYLIESLIGQGEAAHFLEITGGFLTHHTEEGIRYEMFEASEALASKGILSLEEKFLAGEGQNITPARYATDPVERQRISDTVKAELQRAAELLQVTGYARIDAFVKILTGGQVETWIIEVNSLPGMTPATAIFHQAALNGYKPHEFIDRIMQFGRERIDES